MNEGFLMVPWRAIKSGATLEQRGAILDLMSLADQNNWGPFRASDSYLSRRWNKSRRFVRSIIKTLEESGMLEVINPGQRMSRKIIIKRRTETGQKTDRKRTVKTKVKPGQDSKPGQKPDRKRTESGTQYTREEKKRGEDVGLSEVWAEHLRHHKGNKDIPGYAKKAITSALKAMDFSAGDLVGLVRAANLSDHPLFARDIRAEGWDNGTDRSGSLATIFRHDKLAMRIQAAQEWTGSEVASSEFNKIKKALRGHPLDLTDTGLKALKKIGGMTTLGRSKDLSDLRTRYLVEYTNQERQT